MNRWLTPAVFVIAHLAVCWSSLAVAENWSRFRGADGAGISTETGFPVSWGEQDYSWVVDIAGEGHSSPVIWGESLYLTSGLGEGETRRLICLDTRTGKTRWQQDLALNPVHLHTKNSFASGSPVTDGKFVVAAFADETQFLVGCWTTDGEQVWQRTLGEYLSQHGPACSPVIHGKYVILAKDMMGPSKVYALDLETGKTIWEVDREFRRTSYATPIVRTRKDGIDEVICVSGATGITGLELATGKRLWHSKPFPMRTVGSPVLAGDVVLSTCGSGGSGKLLMAIPLDETGELSPKYELSQKLPYVPTPIYHEGLVYLLLDGGIMSCIDAKTGESIYLERIGGKFTGSPILVGNQIVAIDEAGDVVTFAAGREFRELGRVKLDELSHSSPAVANGKMYLRTVGRLYCLPAK